MSYIIENPDNASFISVDGKHFNIFVTWRGSFATGDEWRRSTFIKKFEIKDDYILAETESGTRYIFHRNKIIEDIESCNDRYHRVNLERFIFYGFSVETLETVINNFKEKNDEQTV